METFVPPGWMSRTELVNRTGKVMFGDKWRGPMPTTFELGGMLGPLNARMARRLVDQKAEEPEKAEMHDRVVEKIREAACSGVIRSGIKTSSGRIHEGPPSHFWGGDHAVTAFNTEWVIYGREVWADGRCLFAPDAASGRVLFKRDEAEAWLATLEARPAEGGAPAAAAKTPPAGSLPSIAEVLSAEKPVAQSPNAAAQNSPNNLEAGITEAVPKEIQPLEDETRPPGRPSNIRLVEDELDRRIACGDTLSSQRALAKSLSKWLRKEHPEKTPLAPNTIRNRLGHKMSKAKTTARN